MVKVTCQKCNVEFNVKPHKLVEGKGKFCSRKCYSESSVGKERGSYGVRSPKVSRVCKECNGTFEVAKSQVDHGNGVFCSRQCLGRHNGKMSGRPPVQKKCFVCGTEFVTTLSEIEAGRGLCCSLRCSGKKRTAEKKSLLESKPFVCKFCGKVFTEKHKPSKTRLFCSNACSADSKRKPNKAPSKRNKTEHVKWSLTVILRDKKCVRCGARGNLQAHHIKPFDRHPELELDLSNGVALCPCCHHSQHPTFPLETFIRNGGKSVCHCVVCESPFVPRKTSQRTCSLSCGHKLAGLRRRKTTKESDR